jgi:hypothetical protein
MRVCGEIKQSKIGRAIERNGGKKINQKLPFKTNIKKKTHVKLITRVNHTK